MTTPVAATPQRKRITDTARLDWLVEHKADVAHQSAKVGPGWVREAKWLITTTQRVVSGDTLRRAIDDAMRD